MNFSDKIKDYQWDDIRLLFMQKQTRMCNVPYQNHV